jgi:hypothetical protein
MTRRLTIGVAALFVGLGWASQSFVGSGVGGAGTVYAATHNVLPDPCDRTCLKGLVDSYLAALVAHDPSRVPIARDVKFVENTVPQHPVTACGKPPPRYPRPSKSTCQIRLPGRLASSVSCRKTTSPWSSGCA